MLRQEARKLKAGMEAKHWGELPIDSPLWLTQPAFLCISTCPEVSQPTVAWVLLYQWQIKNILCTCLQANMLQEFSQYATGRFFFTDVSTLIQVGKTQPGQIPNLRKCMKVSKKALRYLRGNLMQFAQTPIMKNHGLAHSNSSNLFS